MRIKGRKSMQNKEKVSLQSEKSSLDDPLSQLTADDKKAQTCKSLIEDECKNPAFSVDLIDCTPESPTKEMSSFKKLNFDNIQNDRCTSFDCSPIKDVSPACKNDSSTSPYKFKSEAIPFVTIDSHTKKFGISPEADKMLRSVKGNISVLSFVGPYRTGKSSLAGRALLDNPKAFQAGATINSCTKGLWLYAKPIPNLKGPKGEAISALVIDSEGLNSFEEDQNHDMKLLTMALLLSSKLFYNSQNAIDEHSLSQLDLVVNLTKRIQLKTNQVNGGEMTDVEGFASVFPAFVWLVRDFSLRLTDKEGVTINSQEYFEMALEEQNGLSEKVAARNRTRALFKSLFKDRDCMTFGRPVCDEKLLNKVSELPDSDLEPRFIRQVQTLRKKVFGKIMPKQLNGKAITGAALADMAHQYVTALNENSMPNIESAWSYIVKNAAEVAQQKAMEEFRAKFEQKTKLPCSLPDLEFDFKEAKKRAVLVFGENIVGDKEDQLFGEQKLKQKMKDLFDRKCKLNDEICQRECTVLLQQSQKQLSTALISGHFKDLFQFEKALVEIETEFIQNGPAGDLATRNLIYEKFRSQIAFEAGLHFINAVKRDCATELQLSQQQLEATNQQKNDLEIKLNDKIKEIQERLNKAQSEQQSMIEENAILSVRNQSLMSQIQTEKEEAKKLISIAKKTANDLIKKAEEEKDLAIADLRSRKNQCKDLENRLQTEKELLQQELDHMNERETQFRQAEKQLQNEVKAIQEERKEDKKLVENEFMDKIEQAQASEQEVKAQLCDLQDQLKEAQQALKTQKVKLEAKVLEMTEKNKSSTTSLESSIQKFKTEIETLKTQNESFKTENEELIVEHKLVIANLETKISEDHSARIDTEKILDTQIALLKQKVNHLNLQLSDVENRLNNSKSCAQSLMKTIEQKDKALDNIKKESIKEKEQLKAKYEDEKNSQIGLLQNQKDQIEQKLIEVQKETNNQELNLKLQLQELQSQFQNSKQSIEEKILEIQKLKIELQQAKTIAKQLNQAIESQKQEMQTQMQNQYEKSQKQLEQQIAEAQEQAESELSVLKQNFASEKESLCKKLASQIQVAKEAEESIRVDYERQLKEEEGKYEEEMEFLQRRLEQARCEMQSKIDECEKQNLLSKNQLDRNEVEKQKLNEDLDALKVSSEEKIYKLVTGHKKEIDSLQQKEEDLQKLLQSKDQTLIQLQLKIDSLTEDLNKVRQIAAEAQNSLQESTEQFQEKINGLRSEISELKDQQQTDLSQSSQELALKDQSISFLKQQNCDLSDRHKLRESELESTCQQIREEKQTIQVQCNQQLKEQRLEIEQKFEQKRISLKKQISDLVSQNGKLVQEKQYFEAEIEERAKVSKEIELELQNDICLLNQQIEQLSEHQQNENDAALERQMTLKARVQELERENLNLQSESDKEQALFEDKIRFLTEQKAKVEQDRQELDKKYKEEQERSIKLRMIEKEKVAKIRKEGVTHLESHYRQQIVRIQDESQKVQEECNQQLMSLKTVNQELGTQITISKRELESLQRNLDEKNRQSNSIESSLKDEVSSLNSKLEELTSSFEAKLEAESIVQKQKLMKMEKLKKEIELAHATQKHSFQIEEAKLSMKADQLQNQLTQSKEECERIQARFDSLSKENQRLKAQRTTILQQSIGTKSTNSSVTKKIATFCARKVGERAQQPTGARPYNNAVYSPSKTKDFMQASSNNGETISNYSSHQIVSKTQSVLGERPNGLEIQIFDNTNEQNVNPKTPQSQATFPYKQPLYLRTKSPLVSGRSALNKNFFSHVQSSQVSLTPKKVAKNVQKPEEMSENVAPQSPSPSKQNQNERPLTLEDL